MCEEKKTNTDVLSQSGQACPPEALPTIITELIVVMIISLQHHAITIMTITIVIMISKTNLCPFPS